MSEWIHANPHRARPYMDREIEAWLDSGAVVRLEINRGGSGYRRLDAWHPMQNALVEAERIVAFRIPEVGHGA